MRVMWSARKCDVNLSMPWQAACLIMECFADNPPPPPPHGMRLGLGLWRAFRSGALPHSVVSFRVGRGPGQQVRSLRPTPRVFCYPVFAVTSREGALLWAIPPGDGAPLAPANSGSNSVPEPPRHLPPEP